MEKIPNGELKLPIGFRFRPTDEELLVHYLKRKVLGLPLPASVIPEFNVFKTDPWSLPGDVTEQRYFFGKVEGNQGESKCKRVSHNYGYWKFMGKEKQITASASNQAIGMRKTLIFYDIKHSNKTKTQWVMYEYRLAGSWATISNTTQNTDEWLCFGQHQLQILKTKFENWFVYRLFQRKRRPRKLGVMYNSLNMNMSQRIIRPNLVDFRVKQESFTGGSPPQPSTPSSSGITEVSPNGSDHEEVSPSINSCYSDCVTKF